MTQVLIIQEHRVGLQQTGHTNNNVCLSSWFPGDVTIETFFTDVGIMFSLDHGVQRTRCVDRCVRRLLGQRLFPAMKEEGMGSREFLLLTADDDLLHLEWSGPEIEIQKIPLHGPSASLVSASSSMDHQIVVGALQAMCSEDALNALIVRRALGNSNSIVWFDRAEIISQWRSWKSSRPEIPTPDKTSSARESESEGESRTRTTTSSDTPSDITATTPNTQYFGVWDHNSVTSTTSLPTLFPSNVPTQAQISPQDVAEANAYEEDRHDVRVGPISNTPILHQYLSRFHNRDRVSYYSYANRRDRLRSLGDLDFE